MTHSAAPALLSPLFHAKDAQAQLAGILSSAMDAIVTLDEQHRIVLYNLAAEKIFGWPAAEMMGKGLDQLMPERFRRARFTSTSVWNNRQHLAAHGGHDGALRPARQR